MNINLSFIILHYKNDEDTIKCIESIIKTNLKDNEIIIVDNGSCDGSGEVIKKKYEGNNSIHIITNNKNLGFARGFNEGITYAKKLFPHNFFVLLNSDTEIISHNWNSVITDKYLKYHFHVLGPDIVNLEGITHGNPRKSRRYTFISMNIMIFKKYIEYLLLLLGIDVIELVIKLRKLTSNNRIDEITQNAMTEQKDVELQGSCYILSNEYVKEYKGLFEGTFLYFEESILKYIMERDNLCSIYTPDLKILHKEYGSTMHIVKTERKRKMFLLRHGIYSRKLLRNMIFRDNINRIFNRTPVKPKL